MSKEEDLLPHLEWALKGETGNGPAAQFLRAYKDTIADMADFYFEFAVREAGGWASKDSGYGSGV